MILSKNAFVDEHIKHPEKIINKIKRGRKLSEVFIVCLADDESRLEIISSKMFFFKYFRERNYVVSGLFKGKDDALEYIRCLTEISFSEFGSFEPKTAISEIEVSKISERFYLEN